ncbi:SMU1112c/YaeR family gloxylase I-like metalloprotein [Wielerella bovis]|uniref:SMU1112c/YaeR family gloxylase I-like metalloprotein n=1 Tax=Wielerella bovis TaxID=2917790 RepID=UPI002019EAF4|nr:VOC family protein [Wielerella bovis]MCG7658056.1 VOC family protein [Wielerella bovis]MCG7660278.1 VOC family protein [Wielerella bovis]
MRHHHTALICSNYSISKKFYTEILGFTVLGEYYRAERQSYKLDLGIGQDYVLELFSFPNPPPRMTQPEACGLRHIAFAVADPVTHRAALQAKGVVCEAIRTDEHTGKLFFFIRDPDGLPIEFYQE